MNLTPTNFLIWLEGFLDGVVDVEDSVVETIREKLASVEQPQPLKMELLKAEPIRFNFPTATEVADEVVKRLRSSVEITISGAEALSEVEGPIKSIVPKSTKDILAALRAESPKVDGVL